MLIEDRFLSVTRKENKESKVYIQEDMKKYLTDYLEIRGIRYNGEDGPNEPFFLDIYNEESSLVSKNMRTADGDEECSIW